MAEGKRLAFRRKENEGGNETESANLNPTWNQRRILSRIYREKASEIGRVRRRHGAFCLCGRGSENGVGEGKWIYRLRVAYGGHTLGTWIENELVNGTESVSWSVAGVSGRACPRRETEVVGNGPFVCSRHPYPSGVVHLWGHLAVEEGPCPLACRGHRTSSFRRHASFAPLPTFSFGPPFSSYPPFFAYLSPRAQPYV